MRLLASFLLFAACSDYAVKGKTSPPEEPTATLTLTPASSVLGPAIVGDELSQTLTLAAAGGDVTIGDATIEGADFTLVDAPEGESLADGAERTFDVVFTAVDAGEHDALVVVHSDADVGDTVTATLTVTVDTAPEPAIAVDPLALTITDGLTGLVTVSSVGTGDLDVSSVTVSGDGFAIVDAGGLPSVVPTGSAVTLEVGYVGADGGVGVLAIASDDPDAPVVEVDLTGIHPVSCDDVDDDADGSSACDDCDDEDPARSPSASEICADGIDQDCDGADATAITLALLPGWGSGSHDTSLIWPDFVADWSRYGTCPVSLVDVAAGFDLAALTSTGATALVITDPAGGGRQYTAAEKTAIRDFVEGGNGGIIATYVLYWDGWDHAEMWDNSDLGDLLGVDPTLLSPAHGENVQTTVSVLDPTHPVCDGVPSTFTLSPYPYAQGRSVPTWTDALLPGASVVEEASDGYMATIVYEGAAWRGVWFTGMADYQSGAPQAMYDAALWTAAR